MKIEAITAKTYRIPIHIPLIEEPIQRMPVVIATVTFEGGLNGTGLTSHFLTRSVATALEGDVLDVLKGVDARRTEHVHELVRRRLNSRGATGTISNALSVVDVAIWDAMGKAQGHTVAELLGGAADAAPVYVTFGFPQYDRDQLVEAARLFRDRGFTRFKMVVAVHPDGWREDARRVRAVRVAIGDEAELMIDANQMFTQAEALSLCHAVEDCALSWFEEPVSANNVAQLRELRGRTRIPIAAGQNLGARQRLYDLVAGGAVDILQPHTLYLGGFTEVRKVAHMAQCADVAIANGGGWPHFNMHAMAGLSNGWRVEYHLGTAAIGEDLLRDPIQPDGDRIEIPKAPGLGLKEDLSHLEEFRDDV